MSDSIKAAGLEAPSGDVLLRGAVAFFSGLLVCGVALAAQAAFLRSVSKK